MKLLKISLCAAVATLGMAGAAFADSAIVVNGGVASDYVFRGITQDEGKADGFGGLDWSNDTKNTTFTAGTWVSSVAWADAENDWYADFTPTVGGVGLDFGAIYYGYWDNNTVWVNPKNGEDDTHINSPYYEVKAIATIPIGMASIKGSIYYSPNYFAESGSATYYEAAFSMPIYKTATVSGAIGEQTISHVTPGSTLHPATVGSDHDVEGCFAGDNEGQKCSDNYTTWNLGVTIPVNEHFSVDARYIGSSATAQVFGNTNLSGAGVNEVVASLKATFP